MTEEKEVKGNFKYEQDSKRYHRFQIITYEGIVGTVYVPKNIEAMPKTITLEYAGREQATKGLNGKVPFTPIDVRSRRRMVLFLSNHIKGHNNQGVC